MVILMKIIYKLLITIIITLICLILIKKSNAIKDTFYKKVYEDSFDFGFEEPCLWNDYFGLGDSLRL